MSKRNVKGSKAASHLRVITATGALPMPKEHAPAKARQAPTTPRRKAAAKGRKSSGSHSSGSHSSSSAQTVTQDVLAALQGGDLRLAVEEIARQIFLGMQSEQQSGTQQSGSYQRQGGF